MSVNATGAAAPAAAAPPSQNSGETSTGQAGGVSTGSQQASTPDYKTQYDQLNQQWQGSQSELTAFRELKRFYDQHPELRDAHVQELRQGKLLREIQKQEQQAAGATPPKPGAEIPKEIQERLAEVDQLKQWKARQEETQERQAANQQLSSEIDKTREKWSFLKEPAVQEKLAKAYFAKVEETARGYLANNPYLSMEQAKAQAETFLASGPFEALAFTLLPDEFGNFLAAKTNVRGVGGPNRGQQAQQLQAGAAPAMDEQFMKELKAAGADSGKRAEVMVKYGLTSEDLMGAFNRPGL